MQHLHVQAKIERLQGGGVVVGQVVLRPPRMVRTLTKRGAHDQNGTLAMRAMRGCVRTPEHAAAPHD